jgi:hypothetical protein
LALVWGGWGGVCRRDYGVVVKGLGEGEVVIAGRARYRLALSYGHFSPERPGDHLFPVARVTDPPLLKGGASLGLSGSFPAAAITRKT